MKRFENRKLPSRRSEKVENGIVWSLRVILLPIFLPVRIFTWVWDYDYVEFFKRL